MAFSYTERVNSEIQRLICLGWEDFELNDDGIRICREIEDLEISFPHLKYEIDSENHESTGVWSRWRIKEISRLVKRHKIDIIWEVGSGHGNVAMPLNNENICVIGIEPLLKGAIVTAKNGIRTYLGTLETLNLPPNSISAIGIFDVLEHLEQPDKLLFEIHRILKPQGKLILSVPAHSWLFSDFDVALGHYLRYSRKRLIKQLEQTGFSVISTRSLFSILVPLAFFSRTLPSAFGRKRNSIETIVSIERQHKIINFLE